MADRGDSPLERGAGSLEPASRRTAVAVRTDDWPAQATDTIVRVVGTVRDKTAGPAITIARGVVYGLLAAIVGTAAVVLITVMAVRFVNVYLPEDVWAAYLLLGAVFTIAGALLMLMSRRTRSGDVD